MGSRLARALLEAGFPLAVCDVRDDAVAPFEALGAVACPTPKAVADRAQTVLASLPTPAVVEAVVKGPDGLREGTAIATFVDVSTTGAVAADLAAALASANVEYLDAPLTGGVAAADARALTVLAAGTREVFERVRPLLETFGKTIVHVGAEPGQGQTAKVLNNLLSATAMVITSEAMTLGVRAGLDPEALLEAFNAGSGRNTATFAKFPRHVLTGTFDAGFRLRLMLKDVRLCLAQARELGHPMVVGGTVEQLWALAAASSDEEADHTEVVRMFERWAGVEVRRSADAEATRA